MTFFFRPFIARRGHTARGGKRQAPRKKGPASNMDMHVRTAGHRPMHKRWKWRETGWGAFCFFCVACVRQEKKAGAGSETKK